MKRRILLVLSFMLIFALCLAPVAEAKGKQQAITFTLKPEATSEVILDKVECTKLGDRETINVSGHSKADGSETGAYMLEVNSAKGTYKTIKVAPETDLLKAKDKGRVSALYTTYTCWLKLTTVDPVNAPLCYTYQLLTWGTDGWTVQWQDDDFIAYAYHPTKFYTNWYREWYHNYPYYYQYSKTRVRKDGDAQYYNYDWGYDNLITQVYHSQSIWGNANGTWSYYFTWSRWGEDASLLKLLVSHVQS